MVLRGRVPVQSLIDRKVTGRAGILCEFDDLTTDTQVWQVFRHVVGVCSSYYGSNQVIDQTSKSRYDKLTDRDIERALECDARLRDTALTDTATVLAQAPSVIHQIKNHELKVLFRLAINILTFEIGQGLPLIDDELLVDPALVLNIKFATSDIWEQLVAEVFSEAAVVRENKHSVRQKERVHLFSNKDNPAENAGNPKRPDITVGTGRNSLILDAKYKQPKKWEITSASMVDQYQMAAYANLKKAPVFIVYPAEPGSKFVETPPKTETTANQGPKVRKTWGYHSHALANETGDMRPLEAGIGEVISRLENHTSSGSSAPLSNSELLKQLRDLLKSENQRVGTAFLPFPVPQTSAIFETLDAKTQEEVQKFVKKLWPEVDQRPSYPNQ